MCFAAEKREFGTQHTAIPKDFQENENTALFLSLVLSGLLTAYPSYQKNYILLFLKPSGFLDLLQLQGRGFRAVLMEADMLLHKIYWNYT